MEAQRKLTAEDLDQAIRQLKENRGCENTGLYKLKMKNLQSMKELVVNGQKSTRIYSRRKKGNFANKAWGRANDIFGPFLCRRLWISSTNFRK